MRAREVLIFAGVWIIAALVHTSCARALLGGGKVLVVLDNDSQSDEYGTLLKSIRGRKCPLIPRNGSGGKMPLGCAFAVSVPYDLRGARRTEVRRLICALLTTQTGAGFQTVIEEANDNQVSLRNGMKFVYAAVVLLAPKAKTIGKDVTVTEVERYLEDGGSVMLVVEPNYSDLMSEVRAAFLPTSCRG